MYKWNQRFQRKQQKLKGLSSNNLNKWMNQCVQNTFRYFKLESFKTIFYLLVIYLWCSVFINLYWLKQIIHQLMCQITFSLSMCIWSDGLLSFLWKCQLHWSCTHHGHKTWATYYTRLPSNIHLDKLCRRII